MEDEAQQLSLTPDGQPDPPETAWVVAPAGAWVTAVVAARDVVAAVCVAVAAVEVVLVAAVVAAMPGIVTAPIAAKRVVAAVAAAAEPTVRRRRSRRPASRLRGVGVLSVLFMSPRMSGAPAGFLGASWESAVKIGALATRAYCRAAWAAATGREAPSPPVWR